MKKSAAPALILVFLILAVGIFVVFRISKNDAPAISARAMPPLALTANAPRLCAPTIVMAR